MQPWSKLETIFQGRWSKSHPTSLASRLPYNRGIEVPAMVRQSFKSNCCKMLYQKDKLTETKLGRSNVLQNSTCQWLNRMLKMWQITQKYFYGFPIVYDFVIFIFCISLQWVRFISSSTLYVLKIHQVKTLPSFGNLVTFFSISVNVAVSVLCPFDKVSFWLSKKISNDQELIQSDPISCPQNQKGN